MRPKKAGPVKIAVVGGGITGLSAAWEAVTGGAEVTLYEAGDRFGQAPHHPVRRASGRRRGQCLPRPGAGGPGLVHRTRARRHADRSHHRQRIRVARRPAAPHPRRRARRADRRQRHGAPRPRLAADHDPTIGAFVRARLGDAVADHWVAPLVGGINAGDIDRLSLRAVTPQLASAAEIGPRLLDALRATRSDTAAAAAPVFEAPAAGMGALADVLVAALRDPGAELHLRTPITRIADLEQYERNQVQAQQHPDQ